MSTETTFLLAELRVIYDLPCGLIWWLVTGAYACISLKGWGGEIGINLYLKLKSFKFAETLLCIELAFDFGILVDVVYSGQIWVIGES